jgi:hypothetical protein
MRKFLSFFFALAVTVGVTASAWGQVGFGYIAQLTPAPSSGGCTQATAFLARVSNHTNDTNYTTMICGMVTDGTWAKLDLLYIFAANNSTDALLNLIGSTTTALSATAPTFAANTGFTGNGSSATINVTGYNLSTGTNFSQNSASAFAWSTEAGTDNNWIVGDSVNFSDNVEIRPLGFSGGSTANITSGSNFTSTGSVATGFGLFTVSRTSSTVSTLYQNTTSIGSATNASAAPQSATPQFLGGGNVTYFSGGIAGGFGGGLTSTDVNNLYGRVHAFLHAVNPTTFPWALIELCRPNVKFFFDASGRPAVRSP